MWLASLVGVLATYMHAAAYWLSRASRGDGITADECVRMILATALILWLVYLWRQALRRERAGR
jgi:hypothetical protein